MFASFKHGIAASSPALAFGIAIVALLAVGGGRQTVSALGSPYQASGAATGANTSGAMVGSNYGYASRIQYRPVFDPPFPSSMLAAAP